MKAKKPALRLEWLDPAELTSNPRNWRTHPGTQVAALADAIAEVGWAGALLYNERTKRLVDGHARKELWAGKGKVPVLIGSWTEAQERKILATLDPIAAMAEANKDALASLLKEVDTNSEALKGLLDGLAQQNHIAGDKPADPGPQIDKAAELQKKWKTKRGQIWRIGTHRLMCGDSTCAEDVGRLMEGKKAGLMNTDPPYGIDYAATKNGIPRSGFRDIQARGGDIANDDLTTGPELQAFLESVIRIAVPHLIDRPAFYLWHPMLTQGTFFAAAAAAAADILIHRQIIWVKPHMVLTRSGMYHWKHELCFYGWIRGKPPEWYGNKSQVSVWELGESQQDRNHPTQKPVELFTRPIENHTKEGEIVYEPFSGSGSQFVAAEQTNRLCYGMEIEPKYVAVALERLAGMGLTPELAP